MEYYLRDDYLIIDISSLFFKTIQEFMDALIPSKKYQHLLITNGWILMDNLKVKRETKLNGNNLSILLYPDNNKYQKVNNDDIKIIYEDELFLIVDKPSDLLVHSDNPKELTLNDMVRSYYKDTKYSLNPIHRLDKETSGLIVYSKSPIFQPLLDSYIENKKIQRTYLAFVKAIVPKGMKFSIDEPLGRDRHNSKKMIVYKNGQEAHTRVTSLGCKGNISVLRCQLQTGRTHQIRVHLSSQKYPIINDELYGVSYDKAKHMGLVSSELRFYQPIKEEEIKVYANIPLDLENLM